MFNTTFKTDLREGSLHGGVCVILCELKYQPALRGDKKKKPNPNHFHFRSRIILTRHRAEHLFISTTPVSLTCQYSMVVPKIAECCWILPERGVPSVHVPGEWWGQRREGQSFRATAAIMSLICWLFAFRECTAQWSLAVKSDFVCLYFFISFYPLHMGLLREGF